VKISTLQQDIVYKTLLEQAIVCITDRSGIITYANRIFCRLSGYNEKELIGKEYCDLLSAEHGCFSHPSIQKHLRINESWKGEAQHIKKNGRSYWLESTVSALPLSTSQQAQYLHLHTDISHNKRILASLNDRAKKQGLLAIIGQLALMSHANIQVFIEQITAAITGTLDMSRGIFYRIDSAQTTASLAAHANINFTGEAAHHVDLTENNMLNFIFQSDTARLIDLHNEKRFSLNKFFLLQNCRYCLAKGISNEKTGHGIILLFSDSYDTIKSNDIDFLQAISNIITETIIRKNIADTLIEEKTLSQKYIDAANVIIVALDKEGKITMTNKKAAATLGHEQSKLIGLSWAENFTPDEAEYKIKDSTTRIFKTEKLPGMSKQLETSVSKIVTKSGEIRLIKWNNAVLHNRHGKIISTISAGEDITEIEKIKREKKRLQSDLQQAQKLEALGQLTGGIAHDFNNILATILGFSQLAIEKLANDKTAQGLKLSKYLKQVEKAGIRGKEIINQLLSFSQTHNNELQQVTLPPLIKDTLKMLRATIPSSIMFNINIDKNIPAVITNPASLNQIILELLLNARDALNNKGVLTVSVFEYKNTASACISCNKTLNGHYISLAIADNGPGIKKNHLPLIFNTDFTTKEQNKGFGKGLSRVHRIVHESAGHIIVDTSPSGTRFSVLFKVSAGLPTINKEYNALNKTEGTSKHIMVVDDENSIAKYLQELFIHCGYKVSVFTDPGQALQALTEQASRYDLLLTDQSMPIMTGTELIEKALKINPDLAVIICTGDSDLIDADKIREMNINGLLKKPISTHDLLECVYRLLQ
jgi:PAS domain S-box-containing protein